MTEPRDLHDMAASHQGTALAEQVATGAATEGYIPISDGPGSPAVWGPPPESETPASTHEHVVSEPVTFDGTETIFTLAHTPLLEADGRSSLAVYLADGTRAIGGYAVAGDVVTFDSAPAAGDGLFDYLVEPAGPAGVPGGAVADSDPGEAGFTWYEGGTTWPPTPGTWAPDTYYPPGSIITDSNGNDQVRFPSYPGLSDSVEPTWATTPGDYTSDLDGYWSCLGPSPDYGALQYTWSAVLDPAGLSGDSVTFMAPTVPNGHWYLGAYAAGLLTGSVEPVWPTNAGNETMTAPGGGYGVDPVTSRPYTTGTLEVTLNGSPLSVGADWDEVDPATGLYQVTTSTGDGDVLGAVYTPDV